jgi:hypothetical protein
VEEGFDPVGLVASAYEGFRSNWEGGSPFAEDVVWHIPVEKGLTLDIPGSGAVMAFLDFAWRVGFTDGFDISDPEIKGKGENMVIAQHTAFASNGDDQWSDDVTIVCRIQDEQIAEVWQFFQNPPAWQAFWASVGATPSTDAPISLPPGLAAEEIVDRAYDCVTPTWLPQALRSLLDTNIVWHGIDDQGNDHDYNGANAVMNYLAWPHRVHNVGGRLAISNRQISAGSGGEVNTVHTLTATVATQTTIDTVRLRVQVSNSRITEVWQTFDHPQWWRMLPQP